MTAAFAFIALTLIAIAAIVTLVIRQMAAARKQQYRDEFGAFIVADRVEKRRENAARRRSEKAARILARRRSRAAKVGMAGAGLAFPGR